MGNNTGFRTVEGSKAFVKAWCKSRNINIIIDKSVDVPCARYVPRHKSGNGKEIREILLPLMDLNNHDEYVRLVYHESGHLAVNSLWHYKSMGKLEGKPDRSELMHEIANVLIDILADRYEYDEYRGRAESLGKGRQEYLPKFKKIMDVNTGDLKTNKRSALIKWDVANRVEWMQMFKSELHEEKHSHIDPYVQCLTNIGAHARINQMADGKEHVQALTTLILDINNALADLDDEIKEAQKQQQEQQQGSQNPEENEDGTAGQGDPNESSGEAGEEAEGEDDDTEGDDQVEGGEGDQEGAEGSGSDDSEGDEAGEDGQDTEHDADPSEGSGDAGEEGHGSESGDADEADDGEGAHEGEQEEASSEGAEEGDAFGGDGVDGEEGGGEAGGMSQEELAGMAEPDADVDEAFAGKIKETGEKEFNSMVPELNAKPKKISSFEMRSRFGDGSGHNYWIPHSEVKVIPVEVPEAERHCDIRKLRGTRQMLERCSLDKQLRRKLQLKSGDRVIHGVKKGNRLSAKNLFRLKNRGTGAQPRVFRKTVSGQVKLDSCVTLLVDFSDSMNISMGSSRGISKYAVATASAVALAEVLAGVNIPHEILGFTEHETRGEFSVIVYEIKKYSEKNMSSEDITLTMSSKKILCDHNIDGQALQLAAERILKQKEKNKVLMVLSDGNPATRTYASGSPRENLRQVTKEIDERSSIHLCAIGIDDDAVQRFYKNWRVIRKIDELSQAVLELLAENLIK